MKLDKAFKIKYGQKQYHNKENLDSGSTLLISSQATDNGCYGFFDIEPKFIPPYITVPSTGSIGWACVQLTPAGIADDALVMTPLSPLSIEYLFYVAVAIREMRWRFNYGRKITPYRLGKLQVISPEDFHTKKSYSQMKSALHPKKSENLKKISLHPNLADIVITKIFDIDRGDFHAISKLQPGNEPTVSRTSMDNGLVGFYTKPKKAKLYPPKTITISTVTGDAFMQVSPFMATDNVLICTPKKKYKVSTLLYIQAALNNVNWRYSYGRQPYLRIFQKTVIKLPVTSSGDLDERYMESQIQANQYFKDMRDRLSLGEIY